MLGGSLYCILSCIHSFGVGIAPNALHFSALILPISFMHFSSCSFASSSGMYLMMSPSMDMQ